MVWAAADSNSKVGGGEEEGLERNVEGMGCGKDGIVIVERWKKGVKERDDLTLKVLQSREEGMRESMLLEEHCDGCCAKVLAFET